ncbi:MAG: VWA domain-containing protein [Acidobacteriota bacterium]
MSRTTATFLGMLAVLAPAVAIARQDAPKPVRESVASIVVEIPVTVIGKDGQPVRGLSAGDFELYDDGKRQAISTLDLVDLAQSAAPADRAGAVPPAARRLWLLVFDLSYSSPSSISRARDGARDFVERSMRATDLAAVGTLSVDTGWKLLVNFTRDKSQLTDAIATLGAPSLTRPSADPLAFAFSPPFGLPAGVSPIAKNVREQAFLESLRDLQILHQKSNDDLLRGRATKLVGSLAGLGRVLDSVRGRKHVLFFSEGFEPRLLTGGGIAGAQNGSPRASTAPDPASATGAGEQAASGDIWKIDSDARFGSASSRNRLTAALAQFQRSDAVLDTIDIGGLRANGDVAPKAEGGSDTLFTMAADSGGDFVRNANQLGGELAKVADRTSLVYLLVYSPKSLSQPGAFHQLRVTVKSPGAKVIARSGYYEPRPFQALTPLEQVLYAGDLVTAGAPTSPIEVRLLTAAFASPAETPQVPIVLEIPGASLLAGGKAENTGVQIYAYANDAAGTLVDYAAAQMTLELSKVRASLESGGLKFYATLYLPAGEYGVRVLVRNTASGRFGVAQAPLSVPAIPGGAPSVLPPFFPDASGQWLMVTGSPRSDAPARAMDYPFAIAGESFTPAALPVVSSGAEARFAVFAYNFGDPSHPASLQVTSAIVAPDGRTQPVELKTGRASAAERGGGHKQMCSFSTAGLPPGRYALKVVVTDPASHASAESAAPFEIR